MPDPMTPEEVRRLRFKSVFRGFDPTQVSAELNRIAEAMETLITERDEAVNAPGPDPMVDEVAAVRRDVGEILDAARQAASAMRTRASTDAEAMVRNAEEEAEEIRSRAEADSRAAPRHMADPDDLDISGERPVGEETPATGEPLLGKPLYPPDAPPGGWGAPAVRVIGRDHPDGEEGEAEHDEISEPEETTEEIADGSNDVAVVTTEDEIESDEGDDEDTTLGEAASEDESEDAEAVEVTETEPPEAATEEDDTAEKAETESVEPAADVDDTAAEPDSGEGSDMEPSEPVETVPLGVRREQIGGLFASLRGDERAEARSPVAPEAPESTVYPLPDHAPADDDEEIESEPIEGLLGEPFDMRERLLLPVTNRCLQGLKRQLADIQNDVVELAVDAEWEPDPDELAEEVRPSLKVLISEAFAAGHAAVQQWSEDNVPRPQITDRDPSTRFVSGLVNDIESSLVGVKAERGRSSAVSRVLRAWRTDEAERRVRSLAHEAFHRGILASVVSIEGHQPRWVVAGSGCALCREKQETVPVTSPLPPVHAACECVIGVVTVTEQQ